MSGIRAPLIQLIDSRFDKFTNVITGTAASNAYQFGDATLQLHGWLWVMDVDLNVDGNRPDASNIVKAVPIADGSYGVHKVGPGAKLRLYRDSATQTYQIIGLAAITQGQVTVLSITYGDDTISVGTPETFGSTWRALNYTELGDSANNGGYAYGTLPYGTLGKFDSDGNIVFVFIPS
jgi:hypothetical protein